MSLNLLNQHFYIDLQSLINTGYLFIIVNALVAQKRLNQGIIKINIHRIACQDET